MFTKEDCSFKAYRKLLQNIKETGKYCDYADVLKISGGGQRWLILRHDIEFSIDRAYQLSKIELEEGICSSYFVQITNNAYNAFSDKNRKMLCEMHRAGHHIGLHYHRGDGNTSDDLKKDIAFQADVLSHMLQVPVDRFSFHRPLKEHLAADLEIDGLINAYGHQFFLFTENPQEDLEVKYIADSNHQWKYIPGGTLTQESFLAYDKIQLLVHPLSWTKNGAQHLENFQMIVKEKHDELVHTIENEWKMFDMLRGKL